MPDLIPSIAEQASHAERRGREQLENCARQVVDGLYELRLQCQREGRPIEWAAAHVGLGRSRFYEITNDPSGQWRAFMGRGRDDVLRQIVGGYLLSESARHAAKALLDHRLSARTAARRGLKDKTLSADTLSFAIDLQLLSCVTAARGLDYFRLSLVLGNGRLAEDVPRKLLLAHRFISTALKMQTQSDATILNKGIEKLFEFSDMAALDFEQKWRRWIDANVPPQRQEWSFSCRATAIAAKGMLEFAEAVSESLKVASTTTRPPPWLREMVQCSPLRGVSRRLADAMLASPDQNHYEWFCVHCGVFATAFAHYIQGIEVVQGILGPAVDFGEIEALKESPSSPLPPMTHFSKPKCGPPGFYRFPIGNPWLYDLPSIDALAAFERGSWAALKHVRETRSGKRTAR